MKIIQVCLCGSFNPQMGYQDNILPKYYKKLGYECITITSQYFKEKGITARDKRKEITLENMIKIIRVPNKYNLPYKVNSFFRLFAGVHKTLIREKPDIIFLHNFQFLSVFQVIKYCKKNNVKVYADSHTDYINSASNWLSKKILHGIIWRYCVKQLDPYVIKFWGVTEQRCEFLNEVYHICSSKIDLLVMGADDDKINFDKKEEIRSNIRELHKISNDDFLIITGGKIDENKNIHLLIDVMENIPESKVKLIIFGLLADDMKHLEKRINEIPNIIYIGWIGSEKVYDYFLAADLGVFPGTHSVLWEQAVGTGLPCIFKGWKGMKHVDVGGNCLILDSIDTEKLSQELNSIYSNKSRYQGMKEAAHDKGIKAFSYYEIAKKSIEL